MHLRVGSCARGLPLVDNAYKSRGRPSAWSLGLVCGRSSPAKKVSTTSGGGTVSFIVPLRKEIKESLIARHAKGEGLQGGVAKG